MSLMKRYSFLLVWTVIFTLVLGTLAFASPAASNTAGATSTAVVYPPEDLPLPYLLERFDLRLVEQYDAFALVQGDPAQFEALRNVGATVQVIKDATTLYMGQYAFDTRHGAPSIPQEWTTTIAPGTSGYQLIQFIGPLKTDWLNQLQDQGLELKGYVPQFGVIVKGTPEAVSAFAQQPYVRWTGVYEPAYRVSTVNTLDPTALLSNGKQTQITNIFDVLNNSAKPAVDSSNQQKYWVELFAGEKATGVLSAAQSLGLDVGPVTPIADGRVRIELTASPLVLAALARVDGVAWVQPAVELQLMNDKAEAVTHSSVAVDHGLDGTGQLVAITDTGLDYGHEMFSDGVNQPGPDHRKVAAFIDLSGLSIMKDKIGHGTHVAGTILGDAPPYGVVNNHDGYAIGAKAVAVKVFNDLGMFGAGGDLYSIFQQAQDAGARINSNSWGGDTNGSYDQLTVDTDRFAHDNPKTVMVFANGNFGAAGADGKGSVGSPGGAKNVISVGAVNTDNPENVPEWSSRGPTQDGRMKPDVLAPGEYITSAKAGTTNEYVDYRGTSMATPNVSGISALVREYFMNGYYPSGKANPQDEFEPTSALVKAVLINGAQEVTGDLSDADASGHYPNSAQGWGLVDVDQSLYFAGDSRTLQVWDSPTSLSTGDKWTGQVNVADGTHEVKIHLVWNDAPGTSGASRALVNDLNLRVTAPDGTTYLGNNLTSINPGYSVTGGEFDTLNNVEGVRLIPGKSTDGDLPTGTYTIEVIGANVASGPQDFAIAASWGASSGTNPAPNPPEEPKPPVEPAPGAAKVALVGDYRGQLDQLLTTDGFDVTSYQRGQVDELVNTMTDFSAVVILKLDNPADISRIQQSASENGVGQVYLGDYPLPYSALGALQDYVGDPPRAQASYGNGPVTGIVDVEHPVLQGLHQGDTMVLVDGMDNDYQTFDGFGGQVIASSAMTTGLRGLIGVIDTPDAPRQVVIGGLGPNEFTDTTAWTDTGRTVLQNAVNWVANQ